MHEYESVLHQEWGLIGVVVVGMISLALLIHGTCWMASFQLTASLQKTKLLTEPHCFQRNTGTLVLLALPLLILSNLQ